MFPKQQGYIRVKPFFVWCKGHGVRLRAVDMQFHRI